MQIQKKPVAFCGGRPFRIRIEELGHGPSRVGMMVVMMPCEGQECHKAVV
jgi:hypothetical protein